MNYVEKITNKTKKIVPNFINKEKDVNYKINKDVKVYNVENIESFEKRTALGRRYL